MSTVISLFLFILAIVYVEWRLKSVNREDSDMQQAAREHFAGKNETKSQLKKLHDYIDEHYRLLNDRLTSIEQKIFAPPLQTGQHTSSPHQADRNRNDGHEGVFFFSWPDEDGMFHHAERQNLQSEQTYYRFELKNSEQDRAEFTFVTMSDTQLSKANNASKKYIERACVFKGTKSLRVHCTPGVARLERGCWVIVEKARIQYL